MVILRLNLELRYIGHEIFLCSIGAVSFSSHTSSDQLNNMLSIMEVQWAERSTNLQKQSVFNFQARFEFRFLRFNGV